MNGLPTTSCLALLRTAVGAIRDESHAQNVGEPKMRHSMDIDQTSDVPKRHEPAKVMRIRRKDVVIGASGSCRVKLGCASIITVSATLPKPATNSP